MTTSDASVATVTASAPAEGGLVEGIEAGTSVEPAIEGAKEGSDQQVSSPTCDILVGVGIRPMGLHSI